MDNWINNLARKSKETMNALSNSDERFNTEHRLKTMRGEEFWDRLVELLKDYAKDHNARAEAEILGVTPLGPYRYQVYAQWSPDRHKRVPVSYAPDRRWIEWGFPNDMIHIHGYLLELVGDHSAVAVVSAGHPAKYQPEDIAKEIIQFVLDYRG